MKKTGFGISRSLFQFLMKSVDYQRSSSETVSFLRQ